MGRYATDDQIRAFRVYRNMSAEEREGLKVWRGKRSGTYTVSAADEGSLALSRHCEGFEDLVLFVAQAREQGFTGAVGVA